MAPVPKEKLLADVQFQGAISDFHPIREFIKAADYDPLLIRVNEDDLFGDGNNYEVGRCSNSSSRRRRRRWRGLRRTSWGIQRQPQQQQLRDTARASSPSTSSSCTLQA
jgi:hypothetical protein